MTSSRRPRRSTSAPKRSSSSSAATVAGAWRRSAIVSNSGTSERSSPTSACVSSSARSRSSGPEVPETMTRVERARAVAGARVAHGAERRVRALVGRRQLVRVQAHVELRDVEAEQLDAPAQVGERPVGDARAAVGAQARVHQLEVGEQLVGVGVAGLAVALEQVLEALADEAQLAAVGLVEVLVADLERERRRARARRCSIERSSSSLTGTMRVETPIARASRRAPRRGSASAPAGGRARATPARCAGPASGLPSWSPPTQEPKRNGAGAAGQPLAVLGEHVGSDVEQRRLEEPQRVADLVDDARAPRAHLVGLPERGDLGRTSSSSRRRAAGASAGSSSASRMRLSCSCACSTVRRAASVGCAVITSSSETAGARARQLGRLDAAAGQPPERLGQRLARDLLLALVAAAAAHAMPRLGHVRELEVQPERAQDGRRALAVERRARSAASAA